MIKVLLFAQLQEEIGERTLMLEADHSTVKQVKEYLQQQYPHALFQAAIAAVNEEYAYDGDTVKDGDIVAFLPPVSGG